MRTLLVTVTGKDRPGVTSALLGALGTGRDTTIEDVEQVVIRGRLVLGVLLRTTAGGSPVRAALQRALDPLGMDVEVAEVAPDDGTGRRGRSHVTVLGHPLRPAALGAIAGCVADYGGNIDRIVRIARYPVTAVELEVSGVDPAVLRPRLALTAADQPAGESSVPDLEGVGRGVVDPEVGDESVGDLGEAAADDGNAVVEPLEGAHEGAGARGQQHGAAYVVEGLLGQAGEQAHPRQQRLGEVELAAHRLLGDGCHLGAAPGVLGQHLDHFALHQGGVDV